ncbi:MAG: hypothetical protein AAF570_05995 [Bacteroidota bacterium]
MAANDDLYHLIQSLGKAEKRHFKIFATAQGNSQKHLLLFNAIEAQTQKGAGYDEGKIRKKLSGQKLLNQLHVTKNYLRNLILKSLRNYHARISKQAEVRDMLRNVEILYRKELYGMCEKELKRAEKVAQLYEDFSALADIAHWRRRMLMTVKGAQIALPEINACLDEHAAATGAMQEQNDLFRLSVNFFDQVFTAGRDADPLLAHPRMATPPAHFRARTLYEYMQFARCIVYQQPDAEAGQILLDLVAYFEAHPHQVREDPAPYVTALNNYVGFLLRSGDKALVLPLLHRIRAIPETFRLRDPRMISIKALLNSYNLELELYRDTGDFAAGMVLIPEVEAFLAQHAGRTPGGYHLLLHYQFAYICFRSGARSQALRWLNRLFNGRFPSAGREDIRLYARLLNLILHFEMGHIIVLKYAVESCRRFLRKGRTPAHHEKALLRFFGRVCTAPAARYPELLEELAGSLFEGMTEKEKANVCDYLDFEHWIGERREVYGARK